MKTITLYNQVIQFDADDTKGMSDREQAYAVLDKISAVLNAADIAGAQILFTGLDGADIISEDYEEEEG